MTLTFCAVHVRTAYLVHQQHEDKAQNQRHSDAGVQLLVAVLMFQAAAQSRVHFTLRLGHLHGPHLAVVVVCSCRNTQGHRRLKKKKKKRL